MPTEYSVEDGLLLYKGRLCVRHYIVLYTHLIQEVYAQPSTAYPGSTKTYQLLAKQYY